MLPARSLPAPPLNSVPLNPKPSCNKMLGEGPLLRGSSRASFRVCASSTIVPLEARLFSYHLSEACLPQAGISLRLFRATNCTAGGAVTRRFRYFSGDFQNDIVARRNLTWEYAVARFSRKFDLRMSFRNNCWHLRNPFLWVSLLVLFLCAGNSIAKGGAIQKGAAASAGPGLTV